MNFQQFCYAFVLGIILGVLVEATDSLFASMLLHAVFNGTSLILTYLMTLMPSFSRIASEQTSGSAFQNNLASMTALLPAALISLILSVLLIMAIAHLNGRLGYIKTWFLPGSEHMAQESSQPVLFCGCRNLHFLAAATELLMRIA